MNETDVIESLKRKEDELENLLNEAKQKALKIKQDALHRAEEMRVSMSKQVERMLHEHKKEEMEKIEKEADIIKAEAKKQAEELRLRVEKRQEKAVEIVVRHIVD